MLGNGDIARYARQIVVPGIGGAGQEKLLSSSVLVVGVDRGCDQAALYLGAAGVRVRRRLDEGPFDAVVVAEAGSLGDEARSFLHSFRGPVCWYAADARGFTCGTHPSSPLPGAPAGEPSSPRLGAVHDAAACDAAAAACAILVGLPVRPGPFRFEVA